jgi:hypothetical protein
MDEPYSDQLSRVEQLIEMSSKESHRAALAAVLRDAKRYRAIEDIAVGGFPKLKGLTHLWCYRVRIPGQHRSFDEAVDSLIEKGDA